MEKRNRLNHPAFKLASIIIFTGLCALVTRIAIPIPNTKGIFSFVDALVYFTGFLFGPITGFIAGGFGPAITDVSLGLPFWAPATIIAHGCQGLLAGLLAIALKKRDSIPLLAYIITGLIGAILMTATYFIAGILIEGLEKSVFSIPFNLLQSGIGLSLSIPLVKLVQKAYPPVKQYLF